MEENTEYVDIEMTEANFELFEDLCEIVDSTPDPDLIKELMAYLIAKDYVVQFSPNDAHSELH